MRCKSVVTAVVLASIGFGCLSQENSIIPVESVNLAQLAGNKLGSNKLGSNNLSSHALSVECLPDGTLIADDLEGLDETANGRELLTYIAQCALADGDVLETVHDGVTYRFPGLLGIAVDWENRGIDTTEQEEITACLVGHVNALGVSVTISARMIDKVYADATERSAFRGYEGTFYGQLFGASSSEEPIYVYACQGDDYDVAIAHGPTDRDNRLCTDGNAGCGEIVAVGRCRDVCETYRDEYGWTDCWGGGFRYSHTMSVFLADEDPDGGNDSCGVGASCVDPALTTETASSGTRAILSCRDSADCTATCDDGDVCTLDGGNATGAFTANVEAGAVAKIDAYGANIAVVTCDGAGTDCEIDCKAAGSCDDTVCTNGASCLVECSDASCGFAICDDAAGVLDCNGDGSLLSCGRDCP